MGGNSFPVLTCCNRLSPGGGAEVQRAVQQPGGHRLRRRQRRVSLLAPDRRLIPVLRSGFCTFTVTKDLLPPPPLDPRPLRTEEERLIAQSLCGDLVSSCGETLWNPPPEENPFLTMFNTGAGTGTEAGTGLVRRFSPAWKT